MIGKWKGRRKGEKEIGNARENSRHSVVATGKRRVTMESTDVPRRPRSPASRRSLRRNRVIYPPAHRSHEAEAFCDAQEEDGSESVLCSVKTHQSIYKKSVYYRVPARPLPCAC